MLIAYSLAEYQSLPDSSLLCALQRCRVFFLGLGFFLAVIYTSRSIAREDAKDGRITAKSFQSDFPNKQTISE